MKPFPHPPSFSPDKLASSWQTDDALRFLVDAIPNAALLTNKEGVILQANAESERLLGYPQDGLKGCSVDALVPERYRSQHPAFRGEYAHKAEARPMGHGRELYALRRDGTEVPVEIGLNPIKTADDLMIVAVIVDITERKKSEEAMRTLNADLEQRVLRRTAMLQTFLESLPGLYVVLTPTFDIVAASNAYLSATMTKREAITGRNLFDVFPDNPNEGGSTATTELRLSLHHVLENAEAHTMPIVRYDIRDDAGRFEERYWSPINSPILDENRRVQFIIHRVEDVTAFMQQRMRQTSKAELTQTQREQMEAEIFVSSLKVQEVNRQLEAANKELEAFSYSVSHDLRAPLRAIDGFSLAVAEDYGSLLPEEGRRYLEIIRQGAQRMGTLIDDLLTFSRLSRRPLAVSPVEMNTLVRNVLAELSAQHDRRIVEIRQGDLPPASGDLALLKQVWLNLLSNAFKYTRRRNPAIIEIGAILQDGETVYFVRDNGTGFDMRYADKLFGVFQRLHRAEDYEGTGVGLAIVQRVVHRHGGRAWADAKEDHGATFYFTLGDHS
ncbi:PAS domain S-box-containing protein [Terrimicrobium sacchariphilum]|uniref:histidine kinase n=1 Tax=Terrimicrobium sacchariphilum TaxID=690879 RepID=A0A146G1M0_TERSA|nr:PAS domain S-box protein [Terrimicrobium sacchariphilum]GAT31550.1 PAS domain S-box-containing protein [Terrimicrobium sacchariphilum]